MADFELHIHAQKFANLGVRVDFDEEAFSMLLDNLIEYVPPEDTPAVKISPAPIWGMSRISRSILARDDSSWPDSSFEPSTRTIGIRAGEDADSTNRLLLWDTRRWASHLNGEFAEHLAERHKSRNLRRGAYIGSTGVGAIAGLELLGVPGVFFGGLTGYCVAAIASARENPYQQMLRNFTDDPKVKAEYGKIIRYQAI